MIELKLLFFFFRKRKITWCKARDKVTCWNSVGTRDSITLHPLSQEKNEQPEEENALLTGR